MILLTKFAQRASRHWLNISERINTVEAQFTFRLSPPCGLKGLAALAYDREKRQKRDNGHEIALRMNARRTAREHSTVETAAY